MEVKPFSWHLPEDYVLAEQVFPSDSSCQWEWMRVQDAVGLVSRDFRYLQTNRSFFDKEFQVANAPCVQ